MMNEYTAFLYGVLLGYAICRFVNARLNHQYNRVVLIIVYLTLLIISFTIEI